MTCKRTNELPQAWTLTAERLRLLAEGQALKERLRELERGHREIIEPRYYFLWRLLGSQREVVERGEAPDWTAIQTGASALIEYCGIHFQMVCDLHKTIAAYMTVAEMALQVALEEIEARAASLVEERALSPRAVAAAPLLH